MNDQIFHEAFKQVTARTKNRLANAELNRFELCIKAEGMVQSGDIKITYSVGRYSGEVSGASLNAVVEEFLRRNGWDLVNAPLMISGPDLDASL